MGATLYRPMRLEDEMQFPKYEGQKFIDVARKDEQYITWLLENTDFNLDIETADWFEQLKANTTKFKYRRQ